MPVNHLYVWENACSSLLPIFWLGCFHDIGLYKLFIYFRTLTTCCSYHCWIFSHSVGCIFLLLMVFFAVKKLLTLIRSNLFVCLLFFPFALAYSLKKIWLWFYWKGVRPMFSSRSFMVSGFTFIFNPFWVYKSILILSIHLHFVYDERKCSNLMLLHVTAQFLIFLNL